MNVLTRCQSAIGLASCAKGMHRAIKSRQFAPCALIVKRVGFGCSALRDVGCDSCRVHGSGCRDVDRH